MEPPPPQPQGWIKINFHAIQESYVVLVAVCRQENRKISYAHY